MRNAGQTPLQAFIMAASMIMCSEIGDKTFLIAALMAMKHPRLTVFSAAFSSLVVMTVLSAALGHAVPALLPPKLTSLAAAILFIVFGGKMIVEGLGMDASMGVDEELHEVEEEIESKELELKNDDIERGFGSSLNEKQLRRATSSPSLSPDGLDDGSDAPLYRERPGRSTKPAHRQLTEGISNLASLVLSPFWVQVFVMTFLGEWGDRSQVATIAMAAGSDYWFVILGAIVGHALCTAAAVVGGRLLATKISLRTVTLSGGACFLVFAIVYFIEGLRLPWQALEDS
jgi:putative Ca2+/H+ antiporter (TMEM165/GDT1 family)